MNKKDLISYIKEKYNLKSPPNDTLIIAFLSLAKNIINEIEKKFKSNEARNEAILDGLAKTLFKVNIGSSRIISNSVRTKEYLTLSRIEKLLDELNSNRNE
jgi:hypothetical protein